MELDLPIAHASTHTPMSRLIPAYLVPWLELDWPIRWSEQFGRTAPLCVEIGFGSGEFLLQEATAHPERNYVGLEISWASIKRLLPRLAQRRISNVRIVHGKAEHAMQWLFKPNTVSYCCANFPDPWPKDRHHRRRLIQPAFIELIADRLTMCGLFTVATDHADYARWIDDVLCRQTRLSPSPHTPHPSDLPGHQPTRYERKALTAYLPIHTFVYTKADHHARPVDTRKVGIMPNVILEGTIPIDHALDASAGCLWRLMHEGVAVVIKTTNAYRQQNDPNGLVECLVNEDDFSQQFGILLRQDSPDTLLVKLAGISQVRPTWGVQQAVWQIARRITERCPGVRVKSSTVGD